MHNLRIELCYAFQGHLLAPTCTAIRKHATWPVHQTVAVETFYYAAGMRRRAVKQREQFAKFPSPGDSAGIN